MRAEYNAQMLETIKNQLKNFPLDRSQSGPQVFGDTAAVLLLLHGDPADPQVVLTQRAMHLNNHAGEVVRALVCLREFLLGVSRRWPS